MMKRQLRKVLCFILVMAFMCGTLQPYLVHAAPKANPTPYGVIVLGDSRTEYLAKLATNKLPNEFFVYGYGMGYDWMVIVGIPQVNAIMAAHPEYTRWKIVNYMGYNDANRIDAYIAQYQNMQTTAWAGCEVYYLSLAAANDQNIYNMNLRNGVAPENMRNTWNDQVIAFNQRLYSAFPMQYVDIYTPMLTTGFIPEDGIHYASVDANNYLLTLIRLGIGN